MPEVPATLQRYERWSEPVMLGLALVFLLALVIPAINPATVRWAGPLGTVTVLLFAVDLGWRVYLADRRLAYLTRNWLDVIIVIVPFLRPLRLLRIAPLLRLLQLGAVGGRMVQRTRDIFNAHGLKYALTLALCFVVIGGSAVLLVESTGNGGIRDFWTAVWWALTTMTTVGYGDVVPVTPMGRAIGALIMCVGVGVFGVFTAVLASYFTRSSEQSTELELLRRIETRLDVLEQRLSK